MSPFKPQIPNKIHINSNNINNNNINNINNNISTIDSKPKHLKSCSRCRKHKTKCNYIETNPNPCTSCSKRGLNCHLELVIPVKRSNIIKNLSNDIKILKNLVNDLIIKDQKLKNLCIEKGVKVDGLIDIKNYNYNNNINTLTDIDEINEANDIPESNDFNDIDIKNIIPSSPNISPSNYKLFDICCYTSDEINSFFETFKNHYLPLIPIFDIKIFNNPTLLLANNHLLFWSIVFIISDNTDIFNNFILKEILHFTSNSHNIDNDNKENNLNTIYSIVLLSYFPIKININNLDSDDDLDTCFFQWLSISKKFIHSISNKNNQFDENNLEINLYAIIFILGNFYSLRLNLPWDQPLDFNLKQLKLSNTFLGNLLNISSLLNKLMNNFTFNDNFNENNDNQNLLINSLSNWKFNLLNLKKNKFNSKYLDPAFEFIELCINLFQNQSFINNNTELLFNNILSFYNSIDNIDISISPIFIKFSLEFILIFLNKLSYSHHFISTSNNQLIIKSSNLYSNLFNKLLTIINYNDTKIIFNLLLDFDSNIKFNESLINILNMKSFKNKLFPGMINDLKILVQKFKSAENTNNTTIEDLKEFFINENINYNSYYKNFTLFQNSFDLVFLYSNEILKLPKSSTNLNLTSTLSTSSTPDLLPELYSDTSSSKTISQPVSQLHSPNHSLNLLEPITINNDKIDLDNIELDLLSYY